MELVLAEAVNTACYVQNRVLVVKPLNKTTYELFHGRTPTLSFMRPFGCHVTILNTIDHLGKFDGKADEGSGPDWLFDIDALTRTINYEPIVTGTQSNGFADTKANDNAGQARKETESVKDYILLPLWTADPPFSQGPKSSQDDGSKPSSDDGKKVDEDSRKDSECNDQEKEDNVNRTNNVNATSTNEGNIVDTKTSTELPLDLNMPELEDYSIFEDDKDVGAEADMNNLDTTIQVSHILTTRIHKDHPLDQVIGALQSVPQTRRMSKNLEEHGFKNPKRKIKEEVYVCQPPGFEDPNFPDRVYKVKTVNGEEQLHALVDGKKIIITESTVRRDLQLEDAEGIDCLPNSTIFEELTRMGSKTTAWNEFSSIMESAIICLATNQKFNFSKHIFESMVRNLDNVSGKFLMYSRKLKRKDTQVPQPSGPTDIVIDKVVHKELGDSLVRAATTASSLEVEWWSQNEIDRLKRRVKKLEKKDRSRTHKLKRLYKVGLSARVKSSRDEECLGEDASKQGRRINAIDADEDITLVIDQDDNEMFDVDALGVSTAATTATITTKEITLAQALEALKTSKPKVKGIVFQEPGKSTTTTTISSLQSQDKGKGIMVEEPVKTTKKKDLSRLDEEITSKLQAEFDEEERLAREKAEKEQEANVALIEEWDDI
ncbi:retrovirus-related pol polyprotein from transposon TNT 1-94 [Tanacetum coccineum]